MGRSEEAVKIYMPELLYDAACGEIPFRRGGAVAVKGDRILESGDADALLRKYPDALRERLDRQVLVPGTVNTHNHDFQSLLRGIAADRPFLEWRDRSLYHYSRKMDLEGIYTGSLFAFAEMMKRGVTTVGDFFYLHNFGLDSDYAVIQAAKDLGLRLALVRTMYDWDGAPAGYVETVKDADANTRKLIGEYADDPMVTVLPAPHSLHAASDEMVLAGHEIAKDYGLHMHIHVSEEMFEVKQVQEAHGGLSPLEYLDQLGVVDEHLVIIHGVWLKPSEIETLGKAGSGLVYCPSSNMFLADGITDIPAMMKAGVKIALGSDGACGNNRISVFEEMRMCSLLQKAKTCDASCVNFHQTFGMGTANGADLLGIPAGRLVAGGLADFVGIDLDDLSMMPVSENLEQVLPNVVYSLEPTAIKTVIVGGRTTVEDGKLTMIDEETVREKVRATMARLG